jgi:hypothetical protein
MTERVLGGGSAAERSEMPEFINPQMATLNPRAPRSDIGFMKSNSTVTGLQVHLTKEGIQPQGVGRDKTFFPHCRCPEHFQRSDQRWGSGGREGRENEFLRTSGRTRCRPTARRVGCRRSRRNPPLQRRRAWITPTDSIRLIGFASDVSSFGKPSVLR